MNINRSNRVPFTRESFEDLSAVALAVPSNQEAFLWACENADVLSLITAEHCLSTFSADELEAEFDDYLDDAFGPVVVAATYEFQHSRVLREVDELAYREAFREYTDSDFVEQGYCYYRRAELCELDRMAVLATLTKHCARHFRMNSAQVKCLRSAETPHAFVAALKGLGLTGSVQSVSRSATTRMPRI